MTDWTDTPPTEAGDYQWRASCAEGWSDVHRVDSRGLWSMRTGGLVRIPLGQWWSVPIPRPGEGTDWRAVAGDLGERLHNMLGAGGTELYDAAVARYTKGG